MSLDVSNNLVPEVINDYNVYLDDEVMIGTADEVTLPKVKMKTTTLSGGGILGEIEAPVPGQAESIELQIKWNHLYSHATKMFNPNKTANLTLRAAQQSANKTGGVNYKGLRIVCIGMPKEIDLGTLKRADSMGSVTTLELTSMSVYVDDTESLTINKLTGDYKVDGEDLRAEINALI